MEPDNYRNTSRISIGLVLIAAGVLLFAYKIGAPIPAWIFTWPVAMIVVGFLLGIKHNFRNNIWIIFTMIGALNLVTRMRPDLNFDAYVGPIIIIGIGLIFILRPSRRWKRHQNQPVEGFKDEWQNDGEVAAEYMRDGAEYIDSVSVFGGVKKLVVSKNFKGGEIPCF